MPARGEPEARPRAGRRNRAPAEDGGEEPSVFLYRLSRPLGEHVVERAEGLGTPPARIVFDVTHHPDRLTALEALRGKRGCLTLTRLTTETEGLFTIR